MTSVNFKTAILAALLPIAAAIFYSQIAPDSPKAQEAKSTSADRAARVRESSGTAGEPSMERANREIIRRAFDAWAQGGTRFFDDVLAPDVAWTITGTGINAGTHRGRQVFIDRAVTPFGARLSSPIVPTVRGIYADGNQVIALWDGRATTRDGQPYRNTYAWFFTMRDGKATEVTAFLDMAAYTEVWNRVRPAPRR